MATIRAANILPTSNVNYGTCDGLTPPYITVRDYEHEYEYQTPTSVFKHAKFRVLIVDKSQDDAETIGEQVDALLQFSTTVTPTTDRCLQESYRVGQLDFNPPLYQFGVEIGYSLTENLP